MPKGHLNFSSPVCFLQSRFVNGPFSYSHSSRIFRLDGEKHSKIPGEASAVLSDTLISDQIETMRLSASHASAAMDLVPVPALRQAVEVKVFAVG